ncbi:hypothetical protein Kpho02_63660 [Kitasatospora phosalacinea]|uniref:Galactosyltransferase C-terminal domain-containing protein n=1 Tax=Kitasatospora phosalacinea TaxID=2065 RepID=A0A9W6QFK4_9ACTN|nr:glycosyltransferase family 2 protein [Kitasatospora phosalacinea]GLW74068.1 hypothetical protein Kpho02_63660 [Kitasatospora phosalacinea]
MPVDWHHVLAGAVLAGTDPVARSYSPPCWKASLLRYAQARTVLDAAAGQDRQLRRLLAAADRGDGDLPRLFGRLDRALVEFAAARPEAAAELHAAGNRIGRLIRLVYHSALSGPPTARPRPAPASGPPVHVVIPFRGGDGDPLRHRNLRACLNALAWQSLPKERYTVTLVESDDAPRHRAVYGSLVDRYVFHRNPGEFNKAAAVNCGASRGSDGNPLLCLLDADIVLDPGFLARAAARAEASWAALPYEDVFCLDADASLAVAERYRDPREDRRPVLLSGYLLRRPPGGCVLLTQDRFAAVGGFDERFVGWGGEDRDLVNRLERTGGVRREPGTLVHLLHERPPMREDHETIMRTGLVRTVVPT